MQCALAVSQPQPAILTFIKHFYQTNPHAAELLTFVQTDQLAWPDYSRRDGLIFFKGRNVIPFDTALQHLLIAEFHTTPTGGHAGITRTYHRIASTFFWPTLKKSVRVLVANQ
ncbi:DNA-directed DNA polymerase protein [Dioscorea alata]|uniref:DNA-directed DNA polymerase protein n=2 Tax=Dioscorea alata TaxID=55571 RepID=A0ACB7WPA7_DIOAL|nr:DNA-directed DNA polymerase protein [Dioscorea alata]KAH7690234.1 DNA-directed DNA polymerase protein [Dioscorea alata]